MTGRRLVAVNRFYWPDHAATSQLLTDLAEHMAETGWTVTVVASRLRYDDPGAVLPPTETHAGVRIRRVWTSRFGRHWLPGRAIDYATFYLTACLALLQEVRRGDVLLAKTDPPLLSVVAALVAKVKGADLVTWCQDLFPEIAAALGMRWAAGPLGRLLERLRDWSLRSARQNVTLCEAMRAHLLARGIPADRLTVIHNWADDKLIHPVPPDANPLRREWGLVGRRVVGYSGNLGRAHDLAGVQQFIETMAAADPNLIFLFIGGGAGFAELERWASARGLANLVFRPYQPREHLAQSLSVPDLHLVSLDPSCEGLIMPSKLYGILAAGRPIVALASPDGSVAQFVHELNCGVVWRTDAAAQVIELINRMATDTALSARIRRSGEPFVKQRALAAWTVALGGTPKAEPVAAVETVRHAA